MQKFKLIQNFLLFTFYFLLCAFGKCQSTNSSNNNFIFCQCLPKPCKLGENLNYV